MRASVLYICKTLTARDAGGRKESERDGGTTSSTKEGEREEKTRFERGWLSCEMMMISSMGTSAKKKAK